MRGPETATAVRGQTGNGLPDCYHCGLSCFPGSPATDDRDFCCEGCLLVYQLLKGNGLCNYYELQDHPGLQAIKPLRKDKFAYLDNPEIAGNLLRYRNGNRCMIRLHIPGVHCASCLWLLEHLDRIHPGILSGRLDFSSKSLQLQYDELGISLREVVELLSTIGYEPHISLDSGAESKRPPANRQRILRLGVAGFCFSFIMMMSFPEYFGGADFEARYAGLLRGINLFLSVPVVFYCAGEFFSTAWKGLRAGTLNIDAPVAVAIAITYLRSLVEILSGTGAGYLDSMSGIVFFMLIGRVVQERSYRALVFKRDYQSYFPLAVSVLDNGMEVAKSLHDLKEGDIAILQHEDLIPADALLLDGFACVDYSFVSGESKPVNVSPGERLYAGGRQTGAAIRIRIVKPMASSLLVELWNNRAFSKDKSTESQAGSRIHRLSRYFTVILFALAAITALFWTVVDPSRLLNAVSSMLIVACPCALLLASTYTNGNLIRIFSRAGLFMRDASVIERLGTIDAIAFDKTGTLTDGTDVELLHGKMLKPLDGRVIHTATRSSRHPYSQALRAWTRGWGTGVVAHWQEIPGSGIVAEVNGVDVYIGSPEFTGVVDDGNVHALVGRETYSFNIRPAFRNGLSEMLDRLRDRFRLSVLSGDQPLQRERLRSLFGHESALRFRLQPAEKLEYVASLQRSGRRVLMVGDGLNDAGALQQSDVGITLAGDVHSFSPACDAILDARRFNRIPELLKLARDGRSIVNLCFFISVLYNLVGLWFAVQGRLNPMIAAILMPMSTLTIVLISTLGTALRSWKLQLRGAKS